MNDRLQLNRRAFLRSGTLVLPASIVLPAALVAEETPDIMRFGLVTDLHYADKPTAGSRHYRETLDKLATAGERLQQDRPEFIVELGDLIDAADDIDVELGFLKRVNDDLSAICQNRHYVLGNHCVHTLTKNEFLGGVAQRDSYYSFDAGENHFVVLDSCFRSDGQPYGRKNFVWTDPNIPAQQLEWLRGDLQATTKKTIVFAHQRLDVSNHYGVKNAGDVRDVLEKSQKVLAVFQGHSHKNDHNEIGGIHYCTLVAMVEGSGADNSGFSMVEIGKDGTIQVEGFVRQKSYRWVEST